MATHLEQGAFGEKRALAFLKEMGYEIITSNWRFKNLEIDIIAKDKDTLVFVEVKTRKSNAYGDPFEFVDRAKQHALIRAADEYLFLSGYEGEIRFDIVSILHKDSVEIELIKDAFWSN